MTRFTMRIEVWEKDPEEENSTFDEYGELYFRDGDNYYAFNKDNELEEISNPFKDRLSLISFNKFCKKIYNIGLNSGVFLPSEDVLSVDGYIIDSIDIIFKEDGIFPKIYHEYYDTTGGYHKDVKYDFYELIDELK